MIGLFAAASMLLPGNATALPDAGSMSAAMAAPADNPTRGAGLEAREARQVLEAIEHHYPDDFRRLVETLRSEADAHPGDGALQARLQARALASFYRSKAAGLANAPAAMLNDINRRQLELIRMLAADDAGLCAEFATTVFVGRFDLPAWYQERASGLGVLMIEAAKAGESRPPDPMRKTLTEADAAIWYDRLLRGEPGTDIKVALGGPDADASGTSEIQCRVGVAAYAAIEHLSSEQGANVTASFLVQALNEAASE